MTILHFNVQDTGVTKQVKYDDSCSAENFMKDYLKNNTNYVSIDVSKYTFKIGAKLLNSDKYKNEILKNLVREGGLVKVFRKEGVHYSN
jgi:hypothetical protein